MRGLKVNRGLKIHTQEILGFKPAPYGCRILFTAQNDAINSKH